MRILVLGGTGFIGPHLLAALDPHAFAVTILNRGHRTVSGVCQLVADRNDAAAMTSVLAGHSFDAAIDLSCYTPRQAEIALDAIGHATRHWIFVSTAAVYTDAGNEPTESAPVGGAAIWGSYGVNKAAAEAVICRSRGRSHTTILRPTYVYGPGNTVDRETFIWGRLLQHRPILIPGRGDAALRFVHVDDLVRAILLCIERVATDAVTGARIYNVAHAEDIALRALPATLARVCGVPARVQLLGTVPTGVNPFRIFPFANYAFRPCPTHLLDDTGWCPRFDLIAGMAQTYRTLDVARLRTQALDTTAEDLLLARMARLPPGER